MNPGKRILKEELIGLNTEVMNGNNPAQVGLKGKIIDETRNTITIQSRDGKKKMLLKDQVKLKITKHGESFLVDGPALQARPEERTKVRHKW